MLRVYVREGGEALAERLSIQHDGFIPKGSKAFRGIHETDVLQFAVSEADFDDLPTQFEDAAAFLAEHEADVATLSAAGEAVLDFGFEPLDVAVQYDRLPRELVRLAAALDVQIELSLYLFPVSDEDDDEPAQTGAV